MYLDSGFAAARRPGMTRGMSLRPKVRAHCALAIKGSQIATKLPAPSRPL
jgi:hypothetical protein